MVLEFEAMVRAWEGQAVAEVVRACVANVCRR